MKSNDNNKSHAAATDSPSPDPAPAIWGQECSLRWKLVTLCPGTAVRHAHSPSKCQQHMTRHMPASAHKNIVVGPSAPGGRGGNTCRRARGRGGPSCEADPRPSREEAHRITTAPLSRHLHTKTHLKGKKTHRSHRTFILLKAF